ncbi:hypothetical protein IW262DRAFT_537802 [Armillaria fumosa]|nr:hypothetical protein IW262DRAFT_537802 [Armillaria fumosa]
METDEIINQGKKDTSSTLDCFGDGSFYVPDTPDHRPGHISGLARLTPTTFVLLGGDCCHHVGDVRPTLLHHSICPCPLSLLQSATQSLCKFRFPKIASEPLLRIPPLPAPSVYQDYEATMQSLKCLAQLESRCRPGCADDHCA